jgi:hypothetical protein
MRRALFMLTFVLGLSALAWSARAIYLEEPREGARPPARIVPPPPPRPLPEPDNALTDVVRRIDVLAGYSYRGLTVFPLETSRVLDGTDYDSLDEALDDGTLLLSERGAGSVPVVVARNVGRRPVLLLAGEILVGGKQNRILRDDALLPAHSGRVELPVYCVEHGRWTGRVEDEGFRESSQVAALGVRAAAQSGASQEEVWGGVGYYQRQLGVDSESGDLQAVQDSPEARRALDDYRRAFRERWRPEAVGMVVARNGRIVGADIFCNARVFREHRDRLLDSYALDCYIAQREHDRPGRAQMRYPEPGRSDAERFLRQALRADYRWESTPGEGRMLRLRGAGLRGSALTKADAVLHAALYGQEPVIVEPPPRVRPLR